VQTFLPYPSFAKSAACLDRQRLGKQRVEAFQILKALQPDSKSGWRNHPAVRMWRGYEDALRHYFNIVSLEWVKRGYRHNMGMQHVSDSPEMPFWFGDIAFHLSHQSNLIRKFPDHYRPIFGYILVDCIPYIWPA